MPAASRCVAVMTAWYLLHCKAGQEARAQTNIDNQGYRCQLMKIARQKILRGKRIQCIEPLFPNYIFIEMDASSANFNALRSTRSVNSSVRFGSKLVKALCVSVVVRILLCLRKTGCFSFSGLTTDSCVFK